MKSGERTQAQAFPRSPGADPAQRRPSRATRTFIRHYLEMVLAMSVGMGIYGLCLVIAGVDVEGQSPEARLLWMALAMTAPMVGWMRYRRHRWAPTLEMSAAMIAPALIAIGLLRAGTADFGVLMGLEHVAMFAGMLAVMLARREEYSRGH